MKKRKAKKARIDRTKSLSTIYYLPFYLIVALIPHLYGFAKYYYTELEQTLFSGEIYVDVYLIWKSRALILLTIIAIVMFIYAIINKKIEFKWGYQTILPISLLGVLLISAITSPYQSEIYLGTRERMEGVYVYFCYFSLIIMGAYYGSDKKFVDNIFRSIFYSTGLMSLITFLQSFKYDIYSMSFLKWIFFPSNIARRSEELINVTMDQGTVGSLFHSNYSGVFMVIGILIGLTYMLKAKNKKEKLVYLLCLSFISFGLITSNSEASMLAFSIALPVYIYFYRETILNDKVYFLIWLGVFISEIVYGYFFNGLEVDRQKYFYLILVITSLVGFFIGKVKIPNKQFIRTSLMLLVFLTILSIPYVGYKVLPMANTWGEDLDVLDIDENTIKIKTSEMPEELEIQYDGKNIEFNKNEKDTITYDIENSTVNIVKGAKTFRIRLGLSPKNEKDIVFSFLDYSLNLLYKEGDFYYLSNRFIPYSQQEADTVKHSKIFADNPFQFTARAYIWSRYIPLVFERPMFGHGPDVFALIFPQNEPMIKFNMYRTCLMIVDKPHSLYLNIMLNFGIIGFAVFALTIVIGLGSAFTDIDKRSGLIIGIIIAILVSGTFNDSLLGISQILYLFLGMAFAKRKTS